MSGLLSLVSIVCFVIALFISGFEIGHEMGLK